MRDEALILPKGSGEEIIIGRNEIKIRGNAIQIFRNEIQIQNPFISFPNRAFPRGYDGPQGPFSFFAASASGPIAAASASAVRLGFIVGLFVFVSGSSGRPSK
jgi:hypothetical protein